MTNEKYIETVNLYSDSLFKVAYSICKNRQDAEDAVQNTFFNLYKSDKIFDSNEHIKNYLMKSTVNNCKHIFLSSWRKNVISFTPNKDDEYYTIDDNDKQYELYHAVMSLSEKYRTVVHLYYYEDYSVKEISQIISEKETTVQTRLMRARKKLKNLLEEVWQDEN